MARLSLMLAVLLLGLAGPANAQVGRWRAHIDEASARFGVPAEWIERVMEAESGGRTHRRGRPIISSAGAMGLMQLMPGTWADLRVRYGLGDDPFEPRANILGGAAYLRLMYDRFGYPGLFGAYNAGPERYSAYLAGRSSLPRETNEYMARTSGAGWQAPVIASVKSTSGSTIIKRGDVSQEASLAPLNARQRLFAIDHSQAQ